MMHIGLYSGSFNPFHNGHLQVATTMLKKYHFDQIWFLVSPDNPLKKAEDLIDETLRLEMVQAVVDEYNKQNHCEDFQTSNIEFDLPKPSYTYITLRKLRQIYPDNKFSLIIGGDNLACFDKWKNYEEILQNHALYVYPRNKQTITNLKGDIIYTSMPFINISSTEIRSKIKNGEYVEDLLPATVLSFILKKHLYQ